MFLQISIKAAGGDGLAITGVMFWDGPEDEIATFTYEEDYDWAAHVCECCLMDPVPIVCISCILLCILYINILSNSWCNDNNLILY